MTGYSGFHVGIVVQNNDPEYWGRVKVLVPEHIPYCTKLYDRLKNGEVIKFNSIDSDLSPALVEFLPELKKLLPWAEYAGPIFGGSSAGRTRIHGKNGVQTSLDDTDKFGSEGSENGFRPSNEYEGAGIQRDDFVIAKDSSPVVNPYGASYVPSNYSGMARGLFSIPNVGAQVYVFYLNEDPMYPVYFASSYGPSSVKQIYTMLKDPTSIGAGTVLDYPADFENVDADTDDSKIFRSKTVLNSNKNTIEMIDTDKMEALKFQHYSGSFKEFNNKTAIEFDTGNYQQLTLGDKFVTVNGGTNISCGKNKIEKIYGTSILHVGKDEYNTLKSIKNYYRQLHEYKRLFPTRRTKYDFAPKECSTYQVMAGVHEICPTCGNIPYLPMNKNGVLEGGENSETTFKSQEDTGINSEVGKSSIVDKGGDMVEYGWSRTPIRKSFCFAEFETPEPYYQGKTIEEALAIAKKGKKAETPEGVPETLITDPSPHPSMASAGYFGGTQCPTCNNQMWIHSKETSGWAVNAPGYSPSTQDGIWVPEIALTPGGTYDIKAQTMLKNITDDESLISDGGDVVEAIGKSKVETIGQLFNDFPSYRVDPIGKLRLDGVYLTQQSVVPYYLPTPHVEPVDVANLPGGDYILTVGNKWNVTVGSNGIIIQTTGGMNLIGGISNIVTKELNLSSEHDMMIDGGERLTIRARKVTINPVEHNALTIDGQLHVTRNTILRGGLYVNGEVGLQHVTAPAEINMTGDAVWKEMDAGGVEEAGDEAESEAEESTEQTFGGCTIPVVISEHDHETFLTIPQHTHPYLQIPCSYKDVPNGVRGSLLNEGRNINSRQVLVAAKRRHNVGAYTECEEAKTAYAANMPYLQGLTTQKLMEADSETYAKVVAKATNMGNPLAAVATFLTGYCNGNEFIMVFMTPFYITYQRNWGGKAKASNSYLVLRVQSTGDEDVEEGGSLDQESGKTDIGIVKGTENLMFSSPMTIKSYYGLSIATNELACATFNMYGQTLDPNNSFWAKAAGSNCAGSEVKDVF